ncbi:MAG: long-chain fatty acid--CoA ligase, partial [Alicyclobacillus sp.]|nr:long-chain fatty acid--CoA ligase [Alicyclobacillus sp.]
MNLATLFEFAVERQPEREALVQPGAARFTYQALADEVGRVAAGLHKCGVEPGDRVVVLLKNRIETVVLYWAVQRLGAVFTPINFRLSPAEVTYCLEDSAANVVVYEEVSEPAVQAALAESQICRIGVGQVQACDLTWAALRSMPGEVPMQSRSDDDPCLMLYTSGTTGRPKGVPRTHRNEYSAALAHIVQNRYQWHECTLGVMPLYHTMGMRSLLSMLMLNGKLVMVPDYSPEVLLAAIEREQVTCAYLVPTLIHDVVNHPDFAKYNLSSLTKLGYA